MTETHFSQILGQTPLDLFRLNLCLAREVAYPDLDIEAYIAKLDRLVAEAGNVLDHEAEVKVRIEQLSWLLFQRRRFRGNNHTYGDPRNSYMNQVLDRGLGIPISLSLLYVTVAQRVGLPAFGVGMPGHFIVAVEAERQTVYLDVFSGGNQLSLEDCARLVRNTTGLGQPFQQEWLQPTPDADILARMLNNLRIGYIQREMWREAAAVIERLRLLTPNNPELKRDLGLIYYHHGRLQKAAFFLDAYLRQSPNAPEAEAIRRNMVPDLTSWGRNN
jgi:regulator of sirC expression with transglutaminase-like and TPR domain